MVKDEVPPSTYRLESEVTTVAVQAMLVASSDQPEDVVYVITKALFENLDKVTLAKGKLIKVENAPKGIGIEVHP